MSRQTQKDISDNSIKNSLEVQNNLERLKTEKKNKIQRQLNENINKEQTGEYIFGTIEDLNRKNKKEIQLKVTFYRQGKNHSEFFNLREPTSPEEYNNKNDLVKIYNYLDISNQESLIGKEIPLKFENDNIKLDIPKNTILSKFEHKFNRFTNINISKIYIIALIPMIISTLVFLGRPIFNMGINYPLMYALTSVISIPVLSVLFIKIMSIFQNRTNTLVLCMISIHILVSYLMFTNIESFVDFVGGSGFENSSPAKVTIYTIGTNTLVATILILYNQSSTEVSNILEKIIGYKDKIKLKLFGPENVKI